MAKLYPPSIEGKLPAFAGETLKVPLIMNRAVGLIEVSGMRAMVKTVQTNLVKANLDGSLGYDATTGKYYAVFELGDFKPNLGQYYKVQIAYKDKSNEIGYYSSAGIIKYTSYPVLEVPGLGNNFYGAHDYVGVYSQENENTYVWNPSTQQEELIESIEKDGTEKVYSYCFELTDRFGNIVETSGVQLHDSTTDKSTTQSQDTWSLRKDLEKDEPYYLTYKVTTMNGLNATTARYLVMDQDSVDMAQDVELLAELNYDDGYIRLLFSPLSKQKEVNMNGSFVLIRTSDQSDFKSWDEVHRFTYSNVSLKTNEHIVLWEDFTVQQGVKYKYAVQAYNSFGLYSNRTYSINVEDRDLDYVYVDFEDAFLYDGERQLKIRYNPKIASFKQTVLETKIDTIGGKYPFIFRNGNVGYKEFSISGLISLQTDPNELFLKGIQLASIYPDRDGTPSARTLSAVDTHLTGENIQREREFKLEVLEWLNNGKPKLFRSPAEGNYIVRLMNISMTPNDTLSRMLHTFNSTAYEVAECNFDNLISLGLITLPASYTTSLRVGQIMPAEVIKLSDDKLLEDYPDITIQGRTISLPSVNCVNITEATPGTIIGLNFANGMGVVSIEIGGTGAYYVQANEHPLISVSLISGTWDKAKITFNYYDDTPSESFSEVAQLYLTDEIRQYIGGNYGYNVISELPDIRREIGQFYYIKVMKRQIEDAWKLDGKYYRAIVEQHTDQGVKLVGLDCIKDFNEILLYNVIDKDDNNRNYYIDGNTGKELISDPDYRFALNPKDNLDYMDLTGSQNSPAKGEEDHMKFGDTFGRVEAIHNVEKVDVMYIGSGVVVDVGYRVKIKEYVVETTDYEVVQAREAWEQAQAELNGWIISAVKEKDGLYEEYVNKVNSTYKTFIEKLEISLENRKG